MSKKKEKSKDKPNKKAALIDNVGLGFEDTLSEEGKEFYRTQIRELEKQLDRYKDKSEELEKEMKDFSRRYSSLEKEKKDIVQYLKRCLDQKEDELSSLSERLASLQQAKDTEKAALELQLSRLRQEFQESKDKLGSENMALAGKLAALEEFRVNKERLMADLDSLQKQLVKQKEEHESAIYNLEKKAVLNCSRLRKEMFSHVAAVAAETHRRSEQNMAETTRRAIQENVDLTAQLGYLSDQSRQLLEGNNALLDQKRQLSLEKAILEPLIKDVTRKNLSNKKVMVLLTDRCKQMEAELQEVSRANEELQQLQTKHTDLLDELASLRQDHISVVEECGEKQTEVDRLGAELMEERKRRGQLENTLQKAAFSLMEALKVPEDEDEEVDAVAKRNQMMKNLLVILNSAAKLGLGPALTDFIPEKSRLHPLPSRGPTTDRAGPRSPVVRSGAHLAHYKIGDLGLMPRPKDDYAAILSKMGPLSKNSRLLLHRKSSSQKKTNPIKLDNLVPPAAPCPTKNLSPEKTLK